MRNYSFPLSYLFSSRSILAIIVFVKFLKYIFFLKKKNQQQSSSMVLFYSDTMMDFNKGMAQTKDFVTNMTDDKPTKEPFCILIKSGSLLKKEKARQNSNSLLYLNF